MNFKALSALVSLSIVSVLAPVRAQDAPAAPPAGDTAYKIESVYTVGDILKYQMKMNMNIGMKTPEGKDVLPTGSMAMNMSATSRIKTAGIKTDGTAVVVMQMLDAKMEMMGQTMPVPETPAITMEIGKNGIAKTRGFDKVPGMEMINQMMSMDRLPSLNMLLPDHPVKVGESWEAKIPSPFGGDDLKVVSTLLAVESLDNQSTLKIKQVMTMPMTMKIGAAGGVAKTDADAMMIMSGQMATTTMMNILPANGRILKSNNAMQGDISMELKGAQAEKSPIGSKFNMTIKGDVNMDLTSVEKASAVPAKPAKPAKKK